MKRTFPIIIAAVAAVVAASAAFAWAGRPAQPPPKPATASGPPPAWAETASASKWLAYAGYCWRTVCADYLPPASRPDLPAIRIARGARLRLHFGFRPTTLVVTTLASTTSRQTVTPAQVVIWRPKRQGAATLSLKGAGGSVTYAVRIGFR